MQPPTDPPDSSSSSRRNRLLYNREQFDDYWIALMSKLRLNDDADALISGRSPHPLISFQRANLAALQTLGFLILSDIQLLHDPFESYERFTDYLASSLARHPPPVPAFGNLQTLEQDYQVHRRAQRFIYSTIVDTLQIGTSMHYARRVRFGAGLHLLQIIRSDNRQVTTRSLMALFSSLLSLQLKPSETFEAFARRLDLLIQRLLNWRPPVILPEQLLLFCALRALPTNPYGPVRHIILASPDVHFRAGMGMLRDVAGTGAQVIRDTLGSGSPAADTKPTSVLCAASCPPPADPSPPPRSARARRTPAGRGRRPRRQRGPSKLCQTEGPCKHHGPHAFHATSECRDPTLSRSKRAQPRESSPAPAFAAAPVPTAQSAHEDTMYSPVFVTRISSSARRRRRSHRAYFSPRRSRRDHFRRDFSSRRASPYDVNSVSHAALDCCIDSYTRPVPGSRAARPTIAHRSTHRSRARPLHRTGRARRGRAARGRRLDRARHNRRACRVFNNRRECYPEGRFQPPRQRQPSLRPGRAFSSHGRSSRGRRCRRHLHPRVPSTSGASQVHNLPLCLSVSLLISCASCGTTTTLPWLSSRTDTETQQSCSPRSNYLHRASPRVRARGGRPKNDGPPLTHVPNAASSSQCSRERNRSSRTRTVPPRRVSSRSPSSLPHSKPRVSVRGSRPKHADSPLTHVPNADSSYSRPPRLDAMCEQTPPRPCSQRCSSPCSDARTQATARGFITSAVSTGSTRTTLVARPTRSDPPPSPRQSVSPLHMDELYRASVRAYLATPSVDESPLQSHLRIGSTLAAQEQLLELGFLDPTISLAGPHLSQTFSHCLMATTSSTSGVPDVPVASPSPPSARQQNLSPAVSSSIASTASSSSSAARPPVILPPASSSSESGVHQFLLPKSLSDRLFDEYTHFANLPDADPPPFVPLCDFDINKLGIERMRDWLSEQRASSSRPKPAPDSCHESSASRPAVPLTTPDSRHESSASRPAEQSTSVSDSDRLSPAVSANLKRWLAEQRASAVRVQRLSDAQRKPPISRPGSSLAPAAQDEFEEYSHYVEVNLTGFAPPPFVATCHTHINKPGARLCGDWLARQRQAFTNQMVTRRHERARARARASGKPILRYADIVDLTASPASPSMPTPAPVGSSSQYKRRFRGHGWSKKGTKQSRRASRAASSASRDASAVKHEQQVRGDGALHGTSTPSVPSMPPPLPRSKTVKSATEPTASAQLPAVPRPVGSHSESPGVPPDRPRIILSKSSAAFDITATSVTDVTDHASASLPHARKYRDPQVRATSHRLRATYAFAKGLHTTLHYPQEFHVALHGRPFVDSSGWYSRPELFGDVGPATAISAVVDHVAARPSSLCNHPSCIYNVGDAFVRRQRHLLSIRQLDSELGRPSDLVTHPSDLSASSGSFSFDRPTPRQGTPSVQPTPTSASSASSSRDDGDQSCFITAAQGRKTVLDSGASRHIESDSSRVRDLRPCDPPITLQGINGATIRVSRQGQADNCSDVLVAPSAAASVRSVSALIDSHNMHIVFASDGAFLAPTSSPQPAWRRIASRGEDGLFHVILGAIPVVPSSSAASAFLSVPQQIKREAVHQLHRSLAHASPRRMRQVLTTSPEVAPSLRPVDVRLFTTCDGCGVGKAARPSAPEKASVRATSFGYRLHADTSGTVRPPTASGCSRLLVVCDDASRWFFLALLRHADMHSVASALRAIFRRVASGESVLRTKYLRSDNGTEFKNVEVDRLLSESDVMRELTCVGTSHQNGVAERAIGVVFATARTMLVDARLPPRFWGEAVMCAAYVHNRLPSSANPNSLSPFEVRYGRRPDLRHLRPFGVRAYVRIQRHVTKVQPRAQTGILIGYGESVSSQKGWRIYLPQSASVITTTAVTFHRDLPSSIASRRRSLVSVTPPDFGGDHAAAAPISSPPSDLPLSLRVPAPPVARTVSSSPGAHAPATSDSPRNLITEPATPLVSEQPARLAASPRRLRSHSVPSDPANHALPPADSQFLDNLPVTRAPPARRPRGRPPANATWDPIAGQYVRAFLAPCLPTTAHVWSMVADSSPSPRTPTTVSQALSSPEAVQWRFAIESELSSHKQCNTWRVVSASDMPPGAKPIRCKWVFKIKRDQNNNITRFKARLTACGYAQRLGRDYDETFAPVACANSIRVLFALAAVLRLYVSQHDVQTAFLYGVLPAGQRVYLSVPEGLHLPSDKVLLCLKGIYGLGLKQAPRLFNQHLTAVIGSLGYSQSRSDPCVFHKQRGHYISILAIVVDDILHIASSQGIIDDFARSMDATYKMKHLGVPQFMVGIKIDMSSSCIRLSQEQFIVQAAIKFGQQDAAPVHTPAHPSGCLSLASVGDSPRLDPAVHPYLSLVGTLLWITITRPDVQVAVSRACSFTQGATMAHWRAALRILRYLHTTRSFALTYNKSPVRPPSVSAYVDAAYGNEHGHRSRRGHLVLLADCVVIWTTRATGTVCQSTSEAEFAAANECVKDVLWLRGLLRELGFTLNSPSIVHEDNQATIAMINNHLVSARNRHFCIRMAWLREQAAAGVVKFAFVKSQDNTADIFTKILPAPQFRLLRDMLVSPPTDASDRS